LESTLKVNQLGAAHTVTAIEKVILPDWDESTCPWCYEGSVFDDIIKANPKRASAVMKRRALKLRSADREGLVEDAFIEDSPANRMKLTINSVLVDKPAHSSVVAAAVASALQEMREEKDEARRLAPNNFPLKSVLTIADLKARYTDPILWAAILRGAYPEELRRALESDESERTKWARARLIDRSPSVAECRRELVLSILVDKLPAEALDQPTLMFFKKNGLAEFATMFEKSQL
jgi:hypothetical protein